eukprot:scaffold1574_cov373-Prasinococcus_capsulatus_cf.AAC.5
MSAFACSSSVAKVSMKTPAAAARKTVAVRPMFSRPATSLRVTNGARVNMMQVASPYLKYYETLSYLPPLSNGEIARQIEYITRNNWSPCIEFDAVGVRPLCVWKWLDRPPCEGSGRENRRLVRGDRKSEWLQLRRTCRAVRSLAITTPLQATTTAVTGPCGSYPCSGAPTPIRF